jgi:hypothetical protein
MSPFNDMAWSVSASPAGLLYHNATLGLPFPTYSNYRSTGCVDLPIISGNQVDRNDTARRDYKPQDEMDCMQKQII